MTGGQQLDCLPPLATGLAQTMVPMTPKPRMHRLDLYENTFLTCYMTIPSSFSVRGNCSGLFPVSARRLMGVPGFPELVSFQ